MIRIKKNIYKYLTIIFLIVLILMSSFNMTHVYATRSSANDFSNLINYPHIYTLVRELQTAHPNWKFVISYTGLNWSDVIYNETVAKHSRSLVQKSLMFGNEDEWVCSVCGWYPYDSGTWFCASDKTAAYYIDPRNWLNEDYIFAFESMNLDSGVQNIDGVRKILSGTFMDRNEIPYIDTAGNQQIIYKSYAQIIMEAAQQYNISPYALASRIKQEQGSGSSSLISGQYTYDNQTTGEHIVFTGYYNYFNIGATGAGSANIIKNGLKKAQEKGWTSPELSIHGGAKFMKEEYVDGYQDTEYLQKYEVDTCTSSLYSHQYMQNVYAPYSQGRSTRNAYMNLGLLESQFTFIVPVFNNMPAMPSSKPGRNISLITEDVMNLTVSSPLTIRSSPYIPSNSNNNVIGKLPIGAKAIRIEKANAISDGYIWDKIMYLDGNNVIIGYVSSEYLAKIDTQQVVSEPKVTTEMCNLRNGAGTTDSKVKQILPSGTGVTVIDKISTPVDGHIWYRVVLEDGTQGYVSKAYLEDGTVEKYKIDGSYVKIAPETEIADIPGAVLNGTVKGTGASITIHGTEYTLVVKGDTNGDGKVDSADLLKIVKHLNKTNLMTIECAADTNGDGKIDSADLAKLVRYLNNTTTLNIR